MLTAEKYLGHQTVQPSTLHAIRQRAGKVSPVAYAQFRYLQDVDIAYQYTRGYWITRYLYETHPDLFHPISMQSPSSEPYINRIAAAMGMTQKQFWGEIDLTLVEHFAGLLAGK